VAEHEYDTNGMQSTNAHGSGFPWRTVAGLVLIIIASTLYAFTLDNGLMPEELRGGDLITHQYAQVQARPSNAPGYPLYSMVGLGWFHGIRSILRSTGIASPNPIPILSSFSTLWALIALWLLYEIICSATQTNERPRGNWQIAFLVSLFYAVTYFFWYYATTTEQYSSAIAQTLAIVYVFMMWLRRDSSLWLLYVLAFLCGLSLAHMLTVAFIVPPIVIAVLWTRPSLLRSPKALIGSIIAALLPLVSYLFVFIRGGSHPEWWGSQSFDSATDWFWSFVSTSQGREELLWAFEPGRPFFGNGFPALVGEELTWVIVLAGLVGILFLRKPFPATLYATLIIYLVFSWLYRFGNWFQVILPAYAVLMIGVGAFSDRLQAYAQGYDGDETSKGKRSIRRSMLVAIPVILLIVAVVWRFDASIARANSRNRIADTALDSAVVLLAQDLPENSVLFAPVDDALALQYLTNVWGLNSDVAIVNSDEVAGLLATRPVLATWDAAPTLLDEISGEVNPTLQVISPEWVQVLSEGREVDSVSDTSRQAVDIVVDDTLTLAAYSVTDVDDASESLELPGRQVIATLLWDTGDGSWPHAYHISVRPTVNGRYVDNSADKGTIIQEDRPMPAQLRFGSSGIPDNGLLTDPYRLLYPDGAAAGDMGMSVILYTQDESGFTDVAAIDIPIGRVLDD